MAEEQRPEGRHQALAALADRQYGVVSVRQLRQLGYSYDAISDSAAAGRLHRLQRGVYAVGRRGVDWHGRCLAGVMGSAPAVASHASAGWIWGLLRYAPGRIDVTARTRRHRKSEVRIHHARLSPADSTWRERIPVTSVARTLLDLATALRPSGLERALERSEERGLFDLAAVDELCARTTHHRGVVHLRQALAIYRDDFSVLRSGVERRFRELVREAGLPPPAMNFAVGGYELDAFWPAERFAVELDVYSTHGSRAAFERDRVRQEDLKLIGVEMIRITARRLEREPVRAMDRLGRLLAARRIELARSG